MSRAPRSRHPTLRTFLERVDRERIAKLGPREYAAVERLARSPELMGSIHAKAALVSTLARSEDQWKRLAAIYEQELDPQGPQGSAETGDSEEKTPRPEILEIESEPVAGGIRFLEPHEVEPSLAERLTEGLEHAREHHLDGLRNAPRSFWVIAIGLLISMSMGGLTLWLLSSSSQVDVELAASQEESIDASPIEQSGVDSPGGGSEDAEGMAPQMRSPTPDGPDRAAVPSEQPGRSDSVEIRGSVASITGTASRRGIVFERVDLDGHLRGINPSSPPELAPVIFVALVILSALAITLGFLWTGLPASYTGLHRAELGAREKKADEQRRQLQEARATEGKPWGLRYHVDTFLPVSRQALLDSAELLGRLFGESPGSDLDAESTIHRTIETGGRFEPVLEPRQYRHDVAILMDLEEGSHPWLGAFRRLLEAWRSQGVVLRCFTFQGAPAFVVEEETGQPLALEDLARQTEGMPMILFSRYLDHLGLQSEAEWLPRLEAWPQRAWLDPNPRHRRNLGRSRRRSVSELEKRGLHRFHLTDAGILRLARFLDGDGRSPGPGDSDVPLPEIPKLEDPNTPINEALRLWAFVGALVPDPGWDQLEAIRRYFPEIGSVLSEPRSLQLLLEWVEARTGESAELPGGLGLRIPPGFQNSWLREQREREKARPPEERLENRARRLLLEQLGSVPPEDAVDRELWRFKRAMHEAMLEPHRAAELLSWIVGSIYHHEALRWLESELARRKDGAGEALPISDRETLECLLGQTESIPLGTLFGFRDWGRSASLRAAQLGAVLVLAMVYVLPRPWIAAVFEEEVQTTNVVRPAIYQIYQVRVLGSRPPGSDRPIMVDLPAGSFQMGDADSAFADERPVHLVDIGAFQISKTEVTVQQYRACVGDGGCDAPGAGGYCNWDIEGRAEHPINCVSWTDARKFAEWIGMRLPSEAEWEYAARSAGLERRYPWGDQVASCDLAIVIGDGLGCGREGTWPVCSRTVGNTEQGLCDMAGNVWEWTEDDWHDDYRGAPVDGSPWLDSRRTSNRVIRGGSWGSNPRFVRSAERGGRTVSHRSSYRGFRVARSLPSVDLVSGPQP